MGVTILLVSHGIAVAACVALLIVIARRSGSIRFLALCACVALLHAGEALYFLGGAEPWAMLMIHAALALLSPLLVMVVRPEASRIEIGVLGFVALAAIGTNVMLGRSPGIVVLAVVVGYLVVERLWRKPTGVAARGIVASLAMIEIFVLVLITTGFRPEFPQLEWWLYAFGEISTIPLLLLLATEREGLPIADAVIHRGVAAIAVLAWIAVAERRLPAIAIGFASIAIWYVVSRWVRGRLVPQRVVDAGLASQRLLARRMSESELVDRTCALLREAFECEVTFDGHEFTFGPRRRAFSAGERSIVEGVRDQLVAASTRSASSRRGPSSRRCAPRSSPTSSSTR